MTKPVIIANGTVLTCDAEDRCGRYVIVVADGKIAAITSELDEAMRAYPGAEIIDASDTLIVPGFVNAHFHGESFLLREATRSLHYGLWRRDETVRQAYDKLLHSSGYDDLRLLYRAAYLAHLKSGTTCVGEYGPQVDEGGFRAMIAGLSTSGPTAVVALQNWDQIRANQSAEHKAKAVINIGGEEEYTVYRFEQLSKAAKEMRSGLLAHIAETHEDMEVVRKNFQRGCLALLNAYNVLRENTVLVHANYVAEEEVQLLREIGATIIVCPRSTAVKQSGYPSLRFFAAQNIRCALGSDWGNTDMLAEMRFTYQLPLIVAGLRAFSAAEVVHMATINGAIALGVAHERGSIETQKRADLIFFKTDTITKPVLRQTCSAEEASEVLIEHFSSSDISAVMIGGTLRTKNGSLVGEGEKEVLDAYRTLHNKFFQEASKNVLAASAETTVVLPFISESRSQEQRFESGFTPSEKPATTPEIHKKPHLVNPLTNRPKVKREPIKPELPKNTRRVFGDDEDI